MGVIARGAKAGGGTNLNSGQTADPAEVNTDFNTIVTEINGALDDANIETGTIPGAKSLRFTGIAAPSAPSSGDVILYLSTGGVLTALNSASVSTALGAGRGEVTNLKVVQTTGSEAASVTITADAIDIEGARATAVNVAASLAASGAGGLDTSTEAADTTYYLWLIRKSSDGTVNGLLSTSATSPTMPSGYDQKRLIGHRRNDGSSNMIRQVQCNDMVLCHATSLGTGQTSDADLDTTNFCPTEVADFVYVSARANLAINWQFDDKDDTSISYGPAQLASNGGHNSTWVRKNASNLFTLNEVAGADTVGGVLLLGWKVKVL